MTFEFFRNPDQIITGLRGSSAAWILGASSPRKVIITHRSQSLEDWVTNLKAFYPGKRVFAFHPLPGTPYVPIPLHEASVQTRRRAIQAILQDEWDFIVTLPQTFLESFPPRTEILSEEILFRVGDIIDPETLSNQLVRMGFNRVEMVSTPGEFARRGAIIDVHQPLHENPVRIEFFDDMVEDIRSFDSETQRSKTKLNHFSLTPHFLWDVGQENISCFSQKGAALWNHSSARKHFLDLVQQLQERGSFPGYQHWTPFLFKTTVSLFNLISGDYEIFLENPEEISDLLRRFIEQVHTQEHEARTGGHVWAEKKELFNLPDFPFLGIPENTSLHFLNSQGQDCDPEISKTTFFTQGIQGSVMPDFNQESQVKTLKSMHVLLFFTSQVLKKRFQDFFPHIDSVDSSSAEDALKNPGVYLFHAALSTGFEWKDRNLLVLSEKDLWPNHPTPIKTTRTQQWVDRDAIDLKPGDFVVHEDHGIGQFEGLNEVQAGGFTFEMITLRYKNDARLHLAFNQLDKIEHLSSEGTNDPQLDTLGGTRWLLTREKVKKALEDMADRLISLYASRTLAELDPCRQDDYIQKEFEEAFEYVATPDQEQAFRDIKNDLMQGKPMDRLLIGDVGFGKTEVAMRMMFKLVNEGHQVAMLCPTTVLAYQHYLTLCERFEGFPVKIAFLSRLHTGKELGLQLQALRDGSCDIAIGTHRLLSKDIAFKNLGGLVVDEEQRFGVHHKERVKEMKKDVHVLSMSATPIPRTLNMALNGIRDISIIRTPPQNRLAITTTVTQFNERLIKNAIEFELSRGGQVYFIHNEIESLPEMAVFIRRLVPHALLGIAHGQMQARDLEKTMMRFIKNELDILVATTLVENGMDVPNANTMLINRAENFGLSQLYQLRGRIGRSDRPAYAYLMVPVRGQLTEKAKKRLTALEEFSSLGSGFRLAALDLEIRGAGNMLGASQSGHIQAVGYSLYMKMLKKAAAKMRGEKTEEIINPIFNLKTMASIPKSFVEDTSQRLSLYKKISTSLTLQELQDHKEQIRDCFGPIPEAMQVLFLENEWRIELIPHRVVALDREGSTLKIQFHVSAHLNLQHIMQLISQTPGSKLSPSGHLLLPLNKTGRGLQMLSSARAMLTKWLTPKE